MSMKLIANQRGFTLAELLVASLVTMMILGGAVALTSQVQQSYRRQIEDAVAEQEGRYALEWVSRLVRAAGNNPYSLPPVVGGTSECPPAVPPTPYAWIVIDPNGDGVNDDIRIQTDSNPPDGILGGTTALGCTQANEDVTVAYDPVSRSITFVDNNLGGAATIRTDAVIDNLQFIYRAADRAVTAVAANVVYVETQVTVRTRTLDAATGEPVTRTLSQEVRIRGRNF
jgi:type II secretory pathway pseudopilin PulG